MGGAARRALKKIEKTKAPYQNIPDLFAIRAVVASMSQNRSVRELVQSREVWDSGNEDSSSNAALSRAAMNYSRQIIRLVENNVLEAFMDELPADVARGFPMWLGADGKVSGGKGRRAPYLDPIAGVAE